MIQQIKHIIAKQPWLMAVAALLVVGVWMASGFVNREDDVATESGDTLGAATGPMRVQVATRQAQNIDRYINIYGSSEPARTVEMAIETEGRVEEIYARRGQRMKTGQPILRLDLRDRQARLEEAKASVREHQTRYDAQQSLQSDGYVSESQMAETLAKLETARAELTRAQLDLANMTIRAPFDGILQERTVEVGDFLRAGDAIGTFVDNTTIIIKASVAEGDASNVKAGDRATAKLVTGQNVSGEIRYVSAVAQRETRTFMVELEVANPDGSLPAGVTAELQVSTGKIEAHKVSPALLTLSTDGTIGINTIDDFDHVQFFPVEIVQSDSDGIWVSGLPILSQVVVVGQGYVSPGQSVIPIAMTTDTALAAEGSDESEQLK